MYTLWRGAQLLGRFEERSPVDHHGRRVGGSGVLIPDAPTESWRGIWQTRAHLFPGAPIMQDDLPKLEHRTHQSSRSPRTSRQSCDLKPLPPGRERGVPEEERLRVQSIEGDVVPTEWIMLEHAELRPGEAAREGFPADWESAWLVTFVELGAI